MDLRSRYLIVGALLAFLGVQAWLVHQNEVRYRTSEDISLVKSDLLRSKSENERLSIEITNLRAEIEQLRKDGKLIGENSIDQDDNMMVFQQAALERCEKQLKKLQNANKEDEVPSLDALHQDAPDLPKEYPDRDIEEEAGRLQYSGHYQPAILNPPANNPATIPTSVQLSCDTAWLAPRVMLGNRFFDIFAMNWDTEIGLVAENKIGGDLMCKFEFEGTTKSTPVVEVSTGYLRAELAHCEIPAEAKKFLQENYYLDFELYDAVAKTSEAVSVCIPEEKKFYYLANCCIYRNDDNIIDQWLQWQMNIGIEHFFLYDHKSTDLSNKVLAKYVKEGKVTYMNWRNNRPEPHNIETYHVAQDAAYLSCTNRFRDRAKWIWTGDTDEFIYTPNEDTVLPILKKYEDNNYLAGVRAVGYRMSDNPDKPLPLIPDPKGETMLVEPYRFNMTFPEKYQYRSTVYTTFKVFVKVKEALYSSIHELAGGGSSIDLSPSDVAFMHFRFERYGRQDSPNDKLVYDPAAFQKFGKKIKLRYAQDMV